jgi:hypothetical protein
MLLNRAIEKSSFFHLTFVDVDLTVSPFEARQTRARVVVDAVDTGGAVQTRIRFALVDVGLAIQAWRIFCKRSLSVRHYILIT